MQQRDLYDVLGANPEASQEELKRCYQRTVLREHPDKNGGREGPAFRAAVEAWSVLGDPASRKEYDARRKQLEGEEDQVWATLRVGEMEEGDENERTYGCRCGGEFVLTTEDGEQLQTGDYDELLVNCDTCSLCIKVLR